MAKFVAHNVNLAVATGAAKFAVAGFAAIQGAPNAARQFAVSTALDQSHLSAKNYVQDGLVAMWDGIENAGWGIHDSDATAWVELVSGIKSPLVSEAKFAENRLVCSAVASGVTVGSHIYTSIEVCVAHYGSAISNVVNPTSGSYSRKAIVYFNNAYAGNESGSPTVKFPVYAEGHTVSLTYGDTPHGYGDGVMQSGISNNYYNIGAGILNYSTFNSARGGIADYYCVRLYSRELSAVEVGWNYAVDKARFSIGRKEQ